MPLLRFFVTEPAIGTLEYRKVLGKSATKRRRTIKAVYNYL
jgi:hypothetical protein